MRYPDRIIFEESITAPGCFEGDETSPGTIVGVDGEVIVVLYEREPLGEASSDSEDVKWWP